MEQIKELTQISTDKIKDEDTQNIKLMKTLMGLSLYSRYIYNCAVKKCKGFSIDFFVKSKIEIAKKVANKFGKTVGNVSQENFNKLKKRSFEDNIELSAITFEEIKKELHINSHETVRNCEIRFMLHTLVKHGMFVLKKDKYFLKIENARISIPLLQRMKIILFYKESAFVRCPGRVMVHFRTDERIIKAVEENDW